MRAGLKPPDLLVHDAGYPKMFRISFFQASLAISFCVLSTSSSLGNELLVPDQDAPVYELSNVRQESPRPGWVQILVDFKRTKEGKGTVFLQGRTATGLQAASVPVFSHVPSGTIKFESYAPPEFNRSINLEFVCVRFNHWRSEMYRYELVSNAVRIGDPGETAKAREWTQEEREAKAEYLRTGGPQAKGLNEKPLQEYKITIEIASDSSVVPQLAKVPEGTKLQACYSSKWNPITALAENEDGTLTIRWDDYGPTFDGRMLREQLIIRKATLASLETHPASRWKSDAPKASVNEVASTDIKPMPATDEQPAEKKAMSANEMRLWIDKTGKFEVRATLVSQTESDVTILTEKGKQVTLPKSKLSKSDVDYLNEASEEKNPFD